MEDIKKFVKDIYDKWIALKYPPKEDSEEKYYLICKDSSERIFEAMPMTTGYF